ncbi:hypothetical protein ERO13_A05G416201v2, partial [Gossypium hirsutum]
FQFSPPDISPAVKLHRFFLSSSVGFWLRSTPGRVNNRDSNSNDETSARASLSRIVMLAEALFENMWLAF